MMVLQALGWALVHSIWQLALVGLGAALLMRTTASVRARYLLVMGALGLCLALPVATFLGGLGSVAGGAAPGAAPALGAPVAAGTAAAAPAAGGSLLSGLLRALAARVTLLAGLWALGATLMMVRFAGGLALARRWGSPGAWPWR